MSWGQASPDGVSRIRQLAAPAFPEQHHWTQMHIPERRDSDEYHRIDQRVVPKHPKVGHPEHDHKKAMLPEEVKGANSFRTQSILAS